MTKSLSPEFSDQRLVTPAHPSLRLLIEQRPCAAFAVFAVLHAVLWTLIPTLLYPNLPLDLIEALTYGREWQLGYDKLPPLPWWLVELTRVAIGHDFAYYLLAQIAVLAAFALVYAAALPLVGAMGALASVLIVDGLHYFSFTAPKFNHDVVQLPFWALAGFSYLAALKSGRLLHWALLGFALGAAFWAKYFVVMLAAPLALYLLVDADARRSLLTPGPYVAGAIALLVAAPHLIWLEQNDFLPLRYAEARAAASRGMIDHLWHPLQFVLSQTVWALPCWLIAWPLMVRSLFSWPSFGRTLEHAGDRDWRIVTLLNFAPAALLLVASAVTGRTLISMWGYPLWLFAGLWIVMTFGRTFGVERFRIAAALWALVTLGYAAAFVAQYAVLPKYDDRYRASLYPGEALAEEMSKRFRTATGRPLAYVVAPMWEGGNVAHYAPDRPRVLIDGRPERAPWIDITDLKSKGAIVLWTLGDLRAVPAPYRAIAGEAQVQEPFSLPFLSGNRVQEFGWAILRPQAQFAAAAVP